MTTSEQRVSNLNLPNVLTTLRIVMVPFFGAALLADGGDSILWRCVAYVLFVVAMITDKIDGDWCWSASGASPCSACRCSRTS